MAETITALLTHYGPGILFVITALASLALPVPASLTLLAAGAFAATTDMSLTMAGAAALAGAVVGDLTAYAIGRWGGSGLWQRLSASPKVGQMMTDARSLLHRRAQIAVLLSRWPFSPMGPYVNYVSGATAVPVAQFGLLCLIGDALWIALYMGLGHVFADRFQDVGHVMSVVVLGLMLVAVVAAVVVWSRRALN